MARRWRDPQKFPRDDLTPPGRGRILVVDDDKAVRDSIRRSLEFNGYTVETATDGVEALACFDVEPVE